MKNYYVSVCQYPLEQLTNWENFCKKIDILCQESLKENSKLLLLPEYFSLELCSLILEKELPAQLSALQKFHEPFLKLFSQLASRYNLYIAAGTFPVQNQKDKFFNRCYFFYPNKNYDYQDKCYLTCYEKDTELFSSADNIKCFDTQLGKIAIQICYDIELPLLTQQYFQNPPELILVPSCTETLAGLNRVVTCARARAIEQQCYVLQAGLVGKSTVCEIIDVAVSEAGIYSPSDYGFTEDGYVKRGKINYSGLYHATIQLRKLNRVKKSGAVSNFLDLQTMKKISFTIIPENINE